MMPLPTDKDVLTTGQVAKMCNVAARTVSKWFDSGQLKGYRIPGSKDRRIPRAQLIKFMKEHGIPLDGIQSGRPRVLIVDDDQEVLQALEKGLKEQTNYEVRVAANGFEAGAECERFKPHVMLLDVHLGDSGLAGGSGGDAKRVAEFVRSDDELQMTRIIAMSGKLTDGQLQALKSSGFDGTLKKPFALRQVVDAIEHVHALVS